MPLEVYGDLVANARGANVRVVGRGSRYQCSAEDVNADGLVDLLFANGGDYETPGEP